VGNNLTVAPDKPSLGNQSGASEPKLTSPASTPPQHAEVSFVQAPVPVRDRRGLLWRFIDYLLLLSVTGVLVTVSLQFISRLIGQALPWTEEVSRYLFIWMAFLGMAAGFRSAQHARVSAFINLMPPLLKRLLVHLYVLAGFVFFSVVAYEGFQLSLRQFHSGETSPALGVGMYLVSLAVALSAALAILAHFESVYRDPALREKIKEGGLQE